jgi:hypothetical protein
LGVKDGVHILKSQNSKHNESNNRHKQMCALLGDYQALRGDVFTRYSTKDLNGEFKQEFYFF